MRAYGAALDFIRPGVPMPELDVLVRERLAYEPTHPICHGVGARAHEPPYPHRAGGGEFEEGMVLAVEPGVYWEGGGGLHQGYHQRGWGEQRHQPGGRGIMHPRADARHHIRDPQRAE